MRVLHLITSLDPPGGAENMLYKLLSCQQGEIKHVVVTMKPKGVFATKISKLGVPVYSLEMYGCINVLFGFKKCVQLLHKIKPDVVLSWMYHANLMAIIAKPFFSKTKLIFNIRHSLSSLNNEKILTAIVIKLNAWFSFLTEAIINNSIQSIEQHNKIGFDRNKSKYIPNGFDLRLFKPNQALYSQFRQQNGFSPETKIIGNLARFHPMKNHPGLIKTFGLIKGHYSAPLKLVLAGKNVDYKNNQLANEIKKQKLGADILLLGEVDSSKIMPALDLYLLTSSWGEGFPNVLGEAMACGVGCVVTKVGDSELIIDKYGGIVEKEDYQGLAEECLNRLCDKKEFDASEIRAHIQNNYSIDKVCKQYDRLVFEVVND